MIKKESFVTKIRNLSLSFLTRIGIVCVIVLLLTAAERNERPVLSPKPLNAGISFDTTCVDPSSGIIAWWPFDDSSTTKVEDIAGNNPGVLVNGTTYAPGKVGSTLHFDGLDDYVGLPDNDLWAFGTGDFTIELWANFDAPGSGSIVHAGDVFISNDEGPGNQNKWFFALGGGVLHFTVYNSAAPPPNVYLARGPFNPVVGQWYHLAVTKKGTLFTTYVDGVPVGSENSSSPISNPDAPLVIGQSNEPFGGFMNGRLDEITIYNRALSEEEFQEIVRADSLGKCKILSITTKSLSAVKINEFFSQDLEAVFGQPPYTWSVAEGFLPSGVDLSTDGALSGRPTEAGEFIFMIRVTDGSGDFAEKEFTLQVLVTLPASEIRVSKTGTLPVPGRVVDYFIAVENVGNVKVNNAHALEYLLPPSYFSYVTTDPPPDAVIEPFLYWALPPINPGEIEIISYSVRLDESVELGSYVPGSILVTICDALGCDQGVGIWLADKLRDAMRKKANRPCLNKEAWDRAIDSCGEMVEECLPIPTIFPCSAASDRCKADTDEATEGCKKPDPGSPDSTMCELLVPEFTVDCDEAVGPLDPNEMVVLPGKYIQPDQLLIYVTHFENIGQVEARDVFVTVVLDDPNLDISTLEILSPNGASFDAATKTVKWDLLDRNLLPGETDNVMFSINPIPGLPSGTEIRNKADIQFEIFEPITTNEVVNVVDTVPPEAWMNQLSSEINSLEFPISWTGTDSIGEIASYSIFVSTDSSGFVPYLERLTATNTTFVGEAGRTYEFICIAEDKAGNVEVQEPVAEVVTHLVTSVEVPRETSPETFTMFQNYPNPFNPETTIRFEVPKTSNVKIVIYDVLGREVFTIVDRKLQAGKYSEIWSGNNNKGSQVASGIYFIRMSASDFVSVKKLLLIK